MIVALDIDGVLRDFNSSLARVYRQRYPNSRPIKEVDEWDLKESYPECENINDFAFRAHGEEIFRTASPYQGAVYFSHRLKKKGYEVIIVTMQYPHLRATTLAWLNAHEVPYDSIMFTDKKYRVNADVLVDDAPHFIAGWKMETGMPAICVARPWNQSVLSDRYHTYAEVLKALLAEEKKIENS